MLVCVYVCDWSNLREYTYVPQGSGIVYITITRVACSRAKDCHREGPRCPKAPIRGVPPQRVKIDTNAMVPSKTHRKVNAFDRKQAFRCRRLSTSWAPIDRDSRRWAEISRDSQRWVELARDGHLILKFICVLPIIRLWRLYVIQGSGLRIQGLG